MPREEKPSIESTFEGARAAFDRLTSLRLADETTEYEFTRGRAQYLAFLIRIEDRAAHDYIASMIERLTDLPGVEPYPPSYWHMTVKGVGFQVIKRSLPDDILRKDVPRITSSAKALLAGQRPFDARLGAMGAFPEVVFIEVHDGERIRELNRLLGDQLPDIARYTIDSGVFLPHVSIARFTSNASLAVLKQRIAPERAVVDGPTISVGRIELVRVWLYDETPEFETLASYNLV